MPKKKGKKKRTGTTAPHIKAYCVQQDLQRVLFRTDIIIYSCDRQRSHPGFTEDLFEPKFVVVCVADTIGEQMSVSNAIDNLAGKLDHDDKLRGIKIFTLTKGDSDIAKYLDGDF